MAAVGWRPPGPAAAARESTTGCLRSISNVQGPARVGAVDAKRDEMTIAAVIAAHGSWMLMYNPPTQLGREYT
jgi:hypothetical protein